jgi:hypothetical protein
MSAKEESKRLLTLIIPKKLVDEFIRNPLVIGDKIPLPENEKRNILNSIADKLSHFEKEENVKVTYNADGTILVEPTKEEPETIKVEYHEQTHQITEKNIEGEESKRTSLLVKIRDFKSGEAKELKLAPGIFPMKYVKVVVTDGGKVLVHSQEQKTKVFFYDSKEKNYKELAPNKPEELKPGDAVVVGVRGETGFWVEQIGDKVADPEDYAHARTSLETYNTIKVSKATAPEPKLEKYVSASERIAKNTIDAVKAGELTLLAEKEKRPIPVVSATGFTALFYFIWRNKEVLSSGTLSEIREKIQNNEKLRGEFKETIRRMMESVEVLENGEWKRRSVTDEHVSKVSDGLLNSNVFIFRLKEQAGEMMEIDEKNPDPIRVMSAYAETIRTVGMIAPALTLDTPRKSELYIKRMDKLLAGDETPKSRFEAVVKTLYKFNEEELSKYKTELSAMEKKREEVIMKKEGELIGQ